MVGVLLTGASGFVGRAVQARIQAGNEHALRIAVRRMPTDSIPGVDKVSSPSLGPEADWRVALKDMDVVVHCAARVHVMNERAADPLVEFRRANVYGTLALARQAVSEGVRRFVYVSSVKVNGEGTQAGSPFFADDEPQACDPYGISKYEAEKGLMELAADSGLEVVIVRPPLVYGPGVKANFLNMMRWLKCGIPLPLGAIDNRRSLVAVENLADLLVRCVTHPAAAGQCFLVSDGEDLSTSDLLRRLGQALGQPARLLPVPSKWIEGVATALGRKDMSQRLCGSLQVNIDKTRELLGWTPPVSVNEALRQTAQHFLEREPS